MAQVPGSGEVDQLHGLVMLIGRTVLRTSWMKALATVPASYMGFAPGSQRDPVAPAGFNPMLAGLKAFILLSFNRCRACSCCIMGLASWVRCRSGLDAWL